LGGISQFATREKKDANTFALSWSAVELRLRDLAVLMYMSSESPSTPGALPRLGRQSEKTICSDEKTMHFLLGFFERVLWPFLKQPSPSDLGCRHQRISSFESLILATGRF
jgi:hypothetical protein